MRKAFPCQYNFKIARLSEKWIFKLTGKIEPNRIEPQHSANRVRIAINRSSHVFSGDRVQYIHVCGFYGYHVLLYAVMFALWVYRI